VPFSEKDEVKRLGGRWDHEKKVWYVPEVLPVSAFTRWLPPKPKINIRSNRLFIATTAEGCWKCKNISPVLGLIVPTGSEHREDSTWFQLPEPSAIYYLHYLSSNLEKLLISYSAHYYQGFSNTAKGTYYANHCQHCKAIQGDFHMYCEPGGAFFPRSPEEADLVTLEEVEAEVEAIAGGVSYGVAEFLYMNRR